jgi:multidrug resistance efflux pump
MRAALFRAEALAVHADARVMGDPLRLTARPVRAAYWVLVASALIAIFFIAFADVNEYATGPAVVRAAGRTDLTLTSPVVVSEVTVAAGARVAPGDILVRFHLPQAASITDKLERALKAPHAGVVEEIRVRPGQYVAASEVFLSIVSAPESFSVVAVLPGRHRPLLREGMPLRMKLVGLPHDEGQDLVITNVGDRVVGPREAKRVLGREVDGSLDIAGSVVIVEAKARARSFTLDGRELAFHEGMTATAEAPVRRQRLIFALLPSLEEALR